MPPAKKGEKAKNKKSLRKSTKITKEYMEITPELRKEVSRDPKLIAAVLQSYSGPLPPPEILKGYGTINQNFPDRIIKMAEKEQNNRLSINRERLKIFKFQVETDRKEIIRGQFFGLLIGLFAMIGGLACILLGKPWPGVLIATSGVGSLVYIFIMGRSGQDIKVHEKNQDKIEKRKPQ